MVAGPTPDGINNAVTTLKHIFQSKYVNYITVSCSIWAQKENIKCILPCINCNCMDQYIIAVGPFFRCNLLEYCVLTYPVAALAFFMMAWK